MPLPTARLCAFATLAALTGVVAGGCQQGKAPPQAPPPPQVTVARPVVTKVQNYFEYNGYLDAVETVQIKARVKGFLNEVKFTEGEEVKAGDLLYLIDPREYKATVAKARADIEKAKADIENGKAQIKLADADLERVGRTLASGAGAKTDYDKAVATVAANRAQHDVAVANKASAEAALQTAELELGFAEIHSPIAGRISRTQVTPGNLVGQNESTLLTTIVSTDPVYVYFDAPEQDLIAYQRAARERPTGPPRVVPVEVGIGAEDGFPHVGRMDFQENRVDTGTGTVRLRGRVPNPAYPPHQTRLLYPGLYARVRIPAGDPQPRPVIPEEALMTGQEGRYVYVLGAGEVVEKRTVTVGAQVGRPAAGARAGASGWVLANPKPPPAADGKPAPPAEPTPVKSVVAIEKGLAPTDRVVVNGLQRARAGNPVTPDEWEFRPPPPAPAGK